MIELTEDQALALSQPHETPLQVWNPRTHEAFVLVRADDYRKLTTEPYDAGPWTREEREAAAWETGNRGFWNDDFDADRDTVVTR